MQENDEELWAILRAKINKARNKNRKLYGSRKKTESRVIIQEIGKFIYNKDYLVTHQVTNAARELILNELFLELPGKSVQKANEKLELSIKRKFYIKWILKKLREIKWKKIKTWIFCSPSIARWMEEVRMASYRHF